MEIINKDRLIIDKRHFFFIEMANQDREKFQELYKIGRKALESGKYRLSVTKLEAAKEMVSFSTRAGAEVQMLLATAYQAAGQRQEAIALCQELTNHPNLSIRQKAKDVLYIIQAPELKRPPEWMSEIPDLSEGEAAKAQYVTTKRTKNQRSQNDELPEIDLSQVNTEDNQFIWFALIIAAITIGWLVFIS